MTLTPISKLLAVELSRPVFTTLVCRGWDWNARPFVCRANASDSWVEDIFKNFKSRQCVFTIQLLSTLEKHIVLYLKKLEFPLLRNNLCQVIVKLAQVFWKRFSKVANIISLCCHFSFLKGQSPSLNRNWIPFTQGCSLRSLVEIVPVVLKKLSMNFYYVAIIPLCKGHDPSVEQT